MARGDYAPVEQENEQVTDYVSLRGVLIWQLEHDSAAHESGDYDQGDIVFLDAHSVHTPRAMGETVVLVLWPAGVRLVEN